MEFFLPPVPMEVMALPVDDWGISYDISTRATENDLPNGWHAKRGEFYSEQPFLTESNGSNDFLGNTYRLLIKRLRQAGFVRQQYSNYVLVNANPVFVWNVMVQLRLIRPPGKLESTLLGLKMCRSIDVTDRMQLGGAFSLVLRGPTPVGLVPDGMDPAPVIPGPDFVRPSFTRPSAAADDPINYRI